MIAVPASEIAALEITRVGRAGLRLAADQVGSSLRAITAIAASRRVNTARLKRTGVDAKLWVPSAVPAIAATTPNGPNAPTAPTEITSTNARVSANGPG